MKYDFNKPVVRTGTNCLKYDSASKFGKPEGLIPLWVADMDFIVPDEVRESLEKCVAHGIFGYTDAAEDYYTAVQKWFESHFGWKTEASWIVTAPGVVFALAMTIRAFTETGDSVMIQQPVYHPFANVIKANGRKIVNNPLICENGKYQMNMEEFERKIIEEKVKLFILCSPHNPVGRVWTEAELKQVGDICLRHEVLVVSDEIHCDFTYPGVTHRVYASLGKEYAEQSIICTAPSKTFNLAGLQAANIWIPNEDIRNRFTEEISKTGYSDLNNMGAAACQAAYEYGEVWLEELKSYLSLNMEFAAEYLTAYMPQIKLIKPQGTYLLWVDFRELGMEKEALNDLLINKAGLWLNDGAMFGESGTGFQRVNIACRRDTLKRALEQLRQAVEGISL